MSRTTETVTVFAPTEIPERTEMELPLTVTGIGFDGREGNKWYFGVGPIYSHTYYERKVLFSHGTRPPKGMQHAGSFKDECFRKRIHIFLEKPPER